MVALVSSVGEEVFVGGDISVRSTTRTRTEESSRCERSDGPGLRLGMVMTVY